MDDLCECCKVCGYCLWLYMHICVIQPLISNTQKVRFYIDGEKIVKIREN